MSSLRLIAIDANVLAAYRESPAQLEQAIGASLGPAADAAIQTLQLTADYLATRSHDSQWGCFLAVDDGDEQLIGTCGYKGPPASNGTVEIAYYTFTPFENRGYATAMASELVTRAGCRRVIAHTLPERNASCRALEKNGFTLSGEVNDPDDGLIWRWVLDKTVDA